jgi:hypothetical protein
VSVSETIPALKSMQQVVGGEWRWDQPRRFVRHYELAVDGAPVARLDWLSRWSWANKARADTAEREWALQRTGFLNREIVIREAPDGRIVGHFDSRWFGRGALTLFNGRVYRWGPEDFWLRQWGFQLENGSPVMQFHREITFARRRARVEFGADTRALPEFPLLLVAGWYKLLLRPRHHGH